MTRRVVVVTEEPLAERLAGPAIRALELSRALVGSADVVLVQGDVLGLQPWLAGADPPLVVDGYDPFHLEQLEQARSLGETRRRAVVRDCVQSLNRQLA